MIIGIDFGIRHTAICVLVEFQNAVDCRFFYHTLKEADRPEPMLDFIKKQLEILLPAKNWRIGIPAAPLIIYEDMKFANTRPSKFSIPTIQLQDRLTAYLKSKKLKVTKFKPNSVKAVSKHLHAVFKESLKKADIKGRTTDHV